VSRDSSVNMETTLWAGRPGVQFPAGAMMGSFLFATARRPILGSTWPPIQCVAGTLFTKRKAAGTWT